MLQTFLTVLPIFLLIGLGFICVRTGILAPRHSEGLAAFVLTFALPAVIVLGFGRPETGGQFHWGFFLAYAAGSLVAFGAVFAIVRLALRRSLARGAIAGLGASASNSGFIAYPVAALLLGAPAMTALPFVMLVENLLVIPLALMLAGLGTSEAGSSARLLRETAGRLLRMPIFLAILAGSALALSGLTLPGPLASTLELLAAAAAPCALIVVGAMVAGLKFGDLSPEIFWIAAGKLLLHPLAVVAFLFLVPGISDGLMAAGILFSCVSMITIYPLLGARFGEGRMSAAALVVATAAGLVTLLCVIAFLPLGTAP